MNAFICRRISSLIKPIQIIALRSKRVQIDKEKSKVLISSIKSIELNIKRLVDGQLIQRLNEDEHTIKEKEAAKREEAEEKEAAKREKAEEKEAAKREKAEEKEAAKRKEAEEKEAEKMRGYRQMEIFELFQKKVKMDEEAKEKSDKAQVFSNRLNIIGKLAFYFNLIFLFYFFLFSKFSN